MREPIFKVGDVVKMKGNIIPMTITFINHKEGEKKITYQCQWFTSDNRLWKDLFYEEILEKCDEKEIKEYWRKK